MPAANAAVHISNVLFAVRSIELRQSDERIQRRLTCAAWYPELWRQAHLQTGKFSSQTSTSIPWSSKLWHPDGVYNGDSVREDVRVVMRGTGFFYRIEGAPFLVTARHMFTTRAWRTNSWMPHPVHAVTPTAMRIHLRVATLGEFDAEKLQYVDFVVPLVDTEGNPAWFEHPGISVDLAARQLLDLPIDGMHFLPLEPKRCGVWR